MGEREGDDRDGRERNWDGKRERERQGHKKIHGILSCRASIRLPVRTLSCAPRMTVLIIINKTCVGK